MSASGRQSHITMRSGLDHATMLPLAMNRYVSARRARDEVIRDASASGMSYRAIAAVVGVSFQRVAQIVRDADAPSR